MAQTFAQFLDSLGAKNRALPIDTLRKAWLRTTGKKPATSSPEAGPLAPSGEPSPDSGALPESAILTSRIQDADERIANTPAQFNPQRRQLASVTGAGLASSGLFDDVGVDEQDIGGNQVFNLRGQRDGFAFTDALTGINSNAAASGTFSSSFARDSRERAVRGLRYQREGALRDFGFAQADITGRQGAQLTDLLSSRSDARAQRTEFQAQQPVNIQPPTPANAQNAGAQTPSVLQPKINYAAGNQSALQAKLDERFGAGTYSVKKRGPRTGGFTAILSQR